MPKYQIEVDGRKFQVDSPEPLTSEQISSLIGSPSSAPATSASPPAPVVPESAKALNTKNIARSALGQGLAFGFGDEIEAGARSLFGGGKYKDIRDQIRAENEAFEKENPVASTVSEVAGGILPAVLTGGATIVPSLAKTAIKKGALYGAGTGALTGAGKAKEAEDIPNDVVRGSLVGGAAGGLLGGATKLIGAPSVNPDVKTLSKEFGMKNFTPGQLIGGAANKIESALSALPLTGAITGTARDATYQSFQKGVVDKVLKPIGATVPNDLKGRELVDATYKAIGQKYDDIAPKLKLDTNQGGFTKQFDNTFLGPDSAVSHLGLNSRMDLLNQANNILLQHAKNGKLEGEAFRRVEKDFNKAAQSYFSKGEQEQGKAMMNALSTFREALETQNPTVGKELKKIHKAFREFLPLERASSMGGAEATGGGIISPQALSSAVKAVGGARSYGKGQAPLQDVAERGAGALGKEIPTSGTAERTFAGNIVQKLADRIRNNTGGSAVGGVGEILVGHGIPPAIAGAIYNPATLKALNRFALRDKYRLGDKALQRGVASAGVVGGQVGGTE